VYNETFKLIVVLLLTVVNIKVRGQDMPLGSSGVVAQGEKSVRNDFEIWRSHQENLMEMLPTKDLPLGSALRLKVFYPTAGLPFVTWKPGAANKRPGASNGRSGSSNGPSGGSNERSGTANNLAANNSNRLGGGSGVASGQEKGGSAFPDAVSLQQDIYVQSFGFFCRKELQVEKATRIPLRVRLGSLDQCNILEQKN
jgi:hypothetical protein